MRYKEPSTNIFFVRHGQTDFPTDRIYCDEIEQPELNATGLFQAKSTAVLLKKYDISAIYASPASRTQMTAKEISDVSGLQVTLLPDWVERRFGIWDGLYFNEIEAKYPEEYQSWKRDQVGFTPDKGETITHVIERLNSSLKELIENHKGENIVLVSHTGPIRVVTCEAMSIPIENYRQLRIDYASLTRIDFGRTKNNLICLNYVNY